MPEAWRIVKTKYISAAFSGISAAEHGGRWNSPDTRVVYVASTTSLAILEILVHLGSAEILSSYSLIRVEFDDAHVLRLDASDLPVNWREHPPPVDTQKIGDAWVKEVSSVLLSVPSVIVPHEDNFLINPNHPEFHNLQVSAPSPFPIDERLRRQG